MKIFIKKLINKTNKIYLSSILNLCNYIQLITNTLKVAVYFKHISLKMNWICLIKKLHINLLNF